MKITIDGTPFPPPEGADAERADAESALALVQAHLNAENLVIQTVAINGCPEEEWGDVLAAMEPHQLHSLEIATVPARTLLRETVAEMAEGLPPLAQLFQQIATDLQRGDDWAGFGKLPTATDRLQSYAQLLAALGGYLPELSSASERRVTALDHWLQKIAGAWQAEDTVLLADYLRYELAPQLDDGNAWLRSLHI